MPEMDGREVGARIKADPAISQTLMMLLTSMGSQGDEPQLKELGFAAYLTKPIKQSQLFDAIAELLRPEEGELPAAQPRAPEPAATGNKQPTRILLVEDNAVNQRLALRLLEKAGYQVEAVGHGRAACAALREQPYDLVLMDIQMPEMDGYEATSAIREFEGGRRHTPIIAMTAHAMKGDRERCLAAGMDDYLTKPLKLEELLVTVARWAAPGRNGRAIEPVDFPALRKAVGGDDLLLRDVIELFLADVPGRIETLREAVAGGNEQVIKAEAHSLKGASGSVGAGSLQESFARLETMGREGQIDRARSALAEAEAEFARVRRYFEDYL